MSNDAGPSLSRRALVAGAAGAAGAAFLERAGLGGAPNQAPAGPRVPTDPTKVQGRPFSEVGQRSPFERPRRTIDPSGLSYSKSPLQDFAGVITPSDLHFERHHAGVPEIDPAQYKLLIHGMVERPTVLTIEALRRYPSESHLYFIECSGNGWPAYRDIRPEVTPQEVDGMTSTSEWTGVRLSVLFNEVVVKEGAKWFLAESMDGAVMARSIPIEKAWDDALIAYGQNGEAVRPEQGYPARLLLPGWEGNTSVKWIRRIEVSDRPFMTREETAKYTDPLADCTARMFSFVMDAKSIITFPGFPAVVMPGWWEITGLAWSGRGRIVRVDVSTDGGRGWEPAELQQPVLPKCHTRFRYLWNWRGSATVLMSRATDESGYVQPTLTALRAARGSGTQYHYNNIRAWKVQQDGRVLFGLEG